MCQTDSSVYLRNKGVHHIFTHCKPFLTPGLQIRDDHILEFILHVVTENQRRESTNQSSTVVGSSVFKSNEFHRKQLPVQSHKCSHWNIHIRKKKEEKNAGFSAKHEKPARLFPPPSNSTTRKQLFVSQECEHLNNRLVPVVFQDNVFILHSSSVN